MSDQVINTLEAKRTTSPDIISAELKNAVDKWIEENPERYKNAQQYGDFLMSSRFANVDEFKVSMEDIEGDIILFNELLIKIQFYGLEELELSELELTLLKKFRKNDWKYIFNFSGE